MILGTDICKNEIGNEDGGKKDFNLWKEWNDNENGNVCGTRWMVTSLLHRYSILHNNYSTSLLLYIITILRHYYPTSLLFYHY